MFKFLKTHTLNILTIYYKLAIGNYRRNILQTYINILLTCCTKFFNDKRNIVKTYYKHILN